MAFPSKDAAALLAAGVPEKVSRVQFLPLGTNDSLMTLEIFEKKLKQTLPDKWVCSKPRAITQACGIATLTQRKFLVVCTASHEYVLLHMRVENSGGDVRTEVLKRRCVEMVCGNNVLVGFWAVETLQQPTLFYSVVEVPESGFMDDVAMHHLPSEIPKLPRTVVDRKQWPLQLLWEEKGTVDIPALDGVDSDVMSYVTTEVPVGSFFDADHALDNEQDVLYFLESQVSLVQVQARREPHRLVNLSPMVSQKNPFFLRNPNEKLHDIQERAFHRWQRQRADGYEQMIPNYKTAIKPDKIVRPHMQFSPNQWSGLRKYLNETPRESADVITCYILEIAAYLCRQPSSKWIVIINDALIYLKQHTIVTETDVLKQLGAQMLTLVREYCSVLLSDSEPKEKKSSSLKRLKPVADEAEENNQIKDTDEEIVDEEEKRREQEEEANADDVDMEEDGDEEEEEESEEKVDDVVYKPSTKKKTTTTGGGGGGGKKRSFVDIEAAGDEDDDEGEITEPEGVELNELGYEVDSFLNDNATESQDSSSSDEDESSKKSRKRKEEKEKEKEKGKKKKKTNGGKKKQRDKDKDKDKKKKKDKDTPAPTKKPRSKKPKPNADMPSLKEVAAAVVSSPPPPTTPAKTHQSTLDQVLHNGSTTKKKSDVVSSSQPSAVMDLPTYQPLPPALVPASQPTPAPPAAAAADKSKVFVLERLKNDKRVIAGAHIDKMGPLGLVAENTLLTTPGRDEVFLALHFKDPTFVKESNYKSRVNHNVAKDLLTAAQIEFVDKKNKIPENLNILRSEDHKAAAATIYNWNMVDSKIKPQMPVDVEEHGGDWIYLLLESPQSSPRGETTMKFIENSPAFNEIYVR